MATEEKKRDIITWIDNSEDQELIDAVHESIAQYKTGHDFWTELSSDQKNKIRKGLEDVDQGRVVSHEEVKNKYGV